MASFLAFAFTPVIKGPWKLGMCSFTRRPITCKRLQDTEIWQTIIKTTAVRNSQIKSHTTKTFSNKFFTNTKCKKHITRIYIYVCIYIYVYINYKFTIGNYALRSAQRYMFPVLSFRSRTKLIYVPSNFIIRTRHFAHKLYLCLP